MSEILAHVQKNDEAFGARVTAYLFGPLMHHFRLYHPALTDSSNYPINVLQVHLTRHRGTPYIQMEQNQTHHYWTLPSHVPIRAYEYESFHPDTQWLFLAQRQGETFPYDTYAALHIVQETRGEVDSYPPPLRYMPSACHWRPLHEICINVQHRSQDIGERVGGYILHKIYPYLKQKYPHLGNFKLQHPK